MVSWGRISSCSSWQATADSTSLAGCKYCVAAQSRWNSQNFTEPLDVNCLIRWFDRGGPLFSQPIGAHHVGNSHWTNAAGDFPLRLLEMMLGFEAITIGKVNETLEMFLFCTVYLLLGKLAAKFCWVQHCSIVVLAFLMMMTMMMLLLMMKK